MNTPTIHKRGEGVRFVFANFIDEPIEQGNQSVVFGFSVGDEYRVSQEGIKGVGSLFVCVSGDRGKNFGVLYLHILPQSVSR